MDENQTQYTYYAFISYKREDEKWARWLQKKLESYGFPVALRKDNPSLPSKIRPVFRDQSELAGGNLKAEIEKGLKGSKYLIVICSPRAAQSPWVSKEVQYFIDNGREDAIIPFIIGGTPNAANPEDECFPEGLRQLSGEKEILGININEMGRDAAAIKVIAHMFGLRFDTLWQRHERAKRRRRLAVIAGVILFALISFGVGAYMAYLNTQISAEKVRANRERDNALQANRDLVIAQDSILSQSRMLAKTNANLEESNHRLKQAKDSILLQSQMLAKTNRDLEESNRNLIEERDNVKKATIKIQNLGSHKTAYMATEYIKNGIAVNGLDLIASSLKEHPELLLIYERQIRAAFDTINYTSYPYSIFSKLPEAISDINYDSINNKIWSVDGTVLKIWDKETQKLTATFKLPQNLADMYNCSINPLFNLYATTESRGNTLSMFKVDSNHNFTLLYEKVGYDFTFSPDYKHLWECVNLGQENAMINLIDIESNNIIESFRGLICGWAPDKLSFVYSVGEWGSPIKYYYYNTITHENTYLDTLDDFVTIRLTNNAENIWYEKSDALGCIYLRNSNNCPPASALLKSLTYGNGIIENINPGFIMVYDRGFRLPVYIGEDREITFATALNNNKILLGCVSGEILLINNPISLKKRYTYHEEQWQEIRYTDHSNPDLIREVANYNNILPDDINIACQSKDKDIVIYSNEEGNINITTKGKIDKQRNLLLNKIVYDIDISPDNKYFVILDGKKVSVYRMLDFVEIYTCSLGDMLGHQIEIETAKNGYNLKIYSSHYEGPEEVPWDSNYVPTILENTKDYIINLPFYSLDHILESLEIEY